MKKIVLYFFGCILFFGCQQKSQTDTQKESTSAPSETSFKMYEMSEMAALMEQMYVDNQRLKQKIENNETDLGEFPEYYLKIHTATFTEPSDLDDFFKSEAQKFIENQKLVYTDTLNIKENFNNMVSSCIECHHKKCTGPIERIKKLYIK